MKEPVPCRAFALVSTLVLSLGFLGGCASNEVAAPADDVSVYVAPRPCAIQRVAVLPFKAPTELIGSSVSDIFTTEMLRAGRYTLVERSQISGVLGETELSMAGLSEQAAIAAGRMLGADGVILGTVDEYGTVALKGRTYPVVGASVRMIDCVSGQVMWSVGYSQRAEDRGATLSGHARQVVSAMVSSLTRNWHVQRKVSATEGGGASRAPPSNAAVSAGPAQAPVPPPQPPGDFSVTDMGLREVALRWRPLPGPGKIRVSRAEKPEGPFLEIALLAANQSGYADRGGRASLADGKTYYYRLASLDALGRESAPSPVRESMTAPPPEPPSALRAATPAARAVLLSWTASASEGVTLYVIERAMGSGAFLRIGESGKSEYRDGGGIESRLGDATDYRYRVRAQNRVGSLGEASAEVAVTTRPRPVEVAGLAARSGELRCVPLAWTAAPEEDVTRYEVFRAEGAKADWVKIATVKGRTETHYLDGGKNPGNLPDGAEYRYRVIAVNGVEARGAPCAEVVARTRPTPPAVKSLETVSGQPRLVTLTWWASEDERVTGYELARAEGAGEFAPIGKQTGLDHCAYRDAGSHGEKPSLKDGTRYRYRVRALHPTGATSEWSEIAEAVTKPVPATPAAPTAVSGLAGRVELSWPANPETDIARYALWAADRESSSYKVIGVTEKATFAEQGLKPGKERWYRVQAIDRDGLESLLSASVRGSSKAVPAAPAGLAAAQDGEGIVLAWTPPAQTDIVRYRILEQKFLGRAEIAEAREPRHRFSTQEIGKGKKVLVQAIDADGLEGEISAPVEIKGMP